MMYATLLVSDDTHATYSLQEGQITIDLSTHTAKIPTNISSKDIAGMLLQSYTALFEEHTFPSSLEYDPTAAHFFSRI